MNELCDEDRPVVDFEIERRAYCSPHLIDYGNIQDLTHGDYGGNDDFDGSTGTFG